MSNGKLVIKRKFKDDEDSDYFVMKEQLQGEYKGIFYGDNNEQKYYEHGAHFLYKDLYRRLEKVSKQLSPSRRGEVSGNIGKLNYK